MRLTCAAPTMLMRRMLTTLAARVRPPRWEPMPMRATRRIPRKETSTSLGQATHPWRLKGLVRGSRSAPGFGFRLLRCASRLALAREQTSPSMVLPRARGPYYLQLASLRSEPRAQDLATKLRRRGHYAYVRGVPSGQGTWHCVRIGPFDSQADALGYQKLLRERDGHEGEVAPRSHDPAD
ncbi:MAG: SPOR domain-containing protein [Polyangiaceae bacterium]|nr:SPOR domain-containing protein [Polyangiaceae bacterium]